MCPEAEPFASKKTEPHSPPANPFPPEKKAGKAEADPAGDLVFWIPLAHSTDSLRKKK